MISALGFGRAAAGRPIAPRGDGRTVGVLAATLTFFATLALALGLAATRLATDWSGARADVATLHVLAPEDAVEAQARAALEVLRTTPGVKAVRLIEVDEQRDLLAPWFGRDLALDSLPLPLLIEVVAEQEAIDRPALDDRLAAEAAGAIYDDHAAWRAPLVASAERLALFAFASVGAMALALAAVLALAASAAVTANGAAVQTLRLVGARDGFIAASLTRRAIRGAALGAVAGTALGFLLVATLPPGDEAGFFLVGIGFAGWGWLAPLAVPPAAVAVALAATRLAARRQIRRWS